MEPISDLRVDRMKKLMDREKLSQEKLGEKLAMSQQAISRILNSKKVSEGTIIRIVEAFPNYRKQWLLGYDDIPTVEEWALRMNQSILHLNTAQNEGEVLFHALSALASLNGFVVNSQSFSGEPEDVVHALYTAYSIEKDGKVINLSVDEMNLLENEINDFAKSRIDYLFRWKEANNG